MTNDDDFSFSGQPNSQPAFLPSGVVWIVPEPAPSRVTVESTGQNEDTHLFFPPYLQPNRTHTHTLRFREENFLFTSGNHDPILLYHIALNWQSFWHLIRGRVFGGSKVKSWKFCSAIVSFFSATILRPEPVLSRAIFDRI